MSVIVEIREESREAPKILSSNGALLHLLCLPINFALLHYRLILECIPSILRLPGLDPINHRLRSSTLCSPLRYHPLRKKHLTFKLALPLPDRINRIQARIFPSLAHVSFLLALSLGIPLQLHLKPEIREVTTVLLMLDEVSVAKAMGFLAVRSI